MKNLRSLVIFLVMLGLLLIPSAAKASATLTLRPDAVGTETSISEQEGVGAHWSLVDDVVPDETTTGVRSTSSIWARDLYGLLNHTTENGIISSVVVYIYVSDGNYRLTKTAIKTHGTVYDGSQQGGAGAVIFNSHSTTYTTNPNTGGAWTWTEIDDMEVGVALYSIGTAYVRCTQVYVVVNYTPGNTIPINSLYFWDGTSADWTDNISVNSANITTLNAPTGRTATKVVAASDAPILVKAQADYIVVGTADDEIQAAINASSGGMVKLVGGTFTSGNLTVDRCLLEGDVNTILNMTGTLTVLNNNTAVGRLSNLYIKYPSNYAAIGVHVNGYPYIINMQHDVLDHIKIYCPTATTGSVGLKLNAVTVGATNSCVAGSNFNDIVVDGFENGVLLYADEIAPATAGYVNGVNIANLIIQNSINLLTLDSGTNSASVSGNSITNVQLQPRAIGTVRGITLKGVATNYNNISNVMIWDWDLASGAALGISNNCVRNYCQGWFAYSVTDNNSTSKSAYYGAANIIIDTSDTHSIDMTELDMGNQGYENNLSNGSFEVGTTPISWTVSGAGATLVRSSAQKSHGSFSGLLTRNGTDCYVVQQITSTYYQSKLVTFATKIYATIASRVLVQIVDSTGSYHNSVYHTGDSTFQWLVVTHPVAASATYVQMQVAILTGDTSCYIDEAIMVVGTNIPLFSPKFGDDSYNSGTTTILSGTTFVEVAHGLPFIPNEYKIRLIPLEVPTNSPRMLGVSDNATATYFWIFTDADPGASNLDVGWSYSEN